MNERAAEANARINLVTAEASFGRLPSLEEVSEIIDLALEAGAHDEAVRAVVNYLWSEPCWTRRARRARRSDNVERLARGLTSEGYRQYLALSLAVLIYVPTGRWEEADAALEQQGEAVFATNRLVWLWLATGQALRRGDLAVVDRYLPEFRESAIATDEPQRILPMAGVAMARAAVANDADEGRRLAEIVLALRMSSFSMAASALPVSRALAAIGDRSQREGIVRVVAEWPKTDADFAPRPHPR